MYIIQHAVNLKNCAFEDMEADSCVYPLPTTPIASHSIINLEIQASPKDMTLLRYITLPSLQRLAYCYSYYEEGLDTLVAFVHRSRPVFEEFSFIYNLIYDDDVYRDELWYDLLLSITMLISDTIPTDENLFMMAPFDILTALKHDRVPLALPNLRGLGLNLPGWTPSLLDLLADIFPDNTTNPGASRP